MWSHSGRIFINAARVYYLPDVESLPPLQWQAETQQFVFMSCENNAVMRATLVNLANIATSTPATASQRPFPSHSRSRCSIAGSGAGTPFVSSVDAVSNSIACECLYGVVPIGQSSSVLLYVSKRSHVTSLVVPEEESEGARAGQEIKFSEKRRHEIYLARQMEWMLLPSRAPRSQSCLPTPLVNAADASRETCGQGRRSSSGGGGSQLEGGSEDDEESFEKVTEDVLQEYLRVIDEFCTQVSRNSGEHSYLYYSPTVNLALSPEEILKGKLRVTPEASASEEWHEPSLTSMLPPPAQQPMGRLGSSKSDLEREPSSRLVFQWNHMLLRAFCVPQDDVELENQLNLAASTKIMRRGMATNSLLSTSATGSPVDDRDGAVYPWSCVHMTDAHGHARFNAMMLYVPCFIRGLVAAYDITQEPPSTLPTVQLHLITRLSCRWAGTRYNRRGLEPNASGAVANFSVSSLWVSTSSSRRDREPTRGGPTTERLAVVNLLRGSVPRRWEQPADLHFKPPAKILFPNNGVDELTCHLYFLKAILPNVKKVACVDTTSTSRLEGPLSDAYAVAVHKLQKEMLRSLPFEAIEEGDGESPASEGGGLPRAKKDPLAAQIALNAKTPISYTKFNMKKKLKAFRYGPLRRNVTAELSQNRMGIVRSSTDGNSAEKQQASGAATAADGGDDTSDRGLSAAGIPSWVDFTCCRYTLSGVAQRRSIPSGSECGTPPLTAAVASSKGCALREQGLYFRVNCLDCLDRTNLFQAMLVESVLPYMLRYVLGDTDRYAGGENPLSETTPTEEKLIVAASTAIRRMMAQQGIALSQLYANSDAHFLSFILNSDLRHLDDNNENTKYSVSVEEGLVALRRWFFQNFRDGSKQDSISLVTLQHDPSLYPSDIESPFSRDLSSMNRLVLYGVMAALIPFLFSLFSRLCFADGPAEKKVHLALCVGWVVYFAFLYRKLSKYSVSYTNRPLLGYTWN